MFILLSSQEFESENDMSVEENFGTQYRYQKIPKDIADMFNSPSYQKQYTKKILDLPVKNSFIPKSFQLIEEKKSLGVVPSNVFNSASTRLWICNQSKFKVSKGFVAVQIYTNNCSFGRSALSQVYSLLWIALFEYYISEITYLAQEANLELNIKNKHTYLLFTVEGFSDSIYNYIEQIFEKLKQFDVKKIGSRIFNIYLEKVEQDLYNSFKEPPSQIAVDFGYVAMSHTARFTV